MRSRCCWGEETVNEDEGTAGALAADPQLGAGNVLARVLAHGADPQGPGLTFDTPVDGYPAGQPLTLGRLDERVAARAAWLHARGCSPVTRSPSGPPPPPTWC